MEPNDELAGSTKDGDSDMSESFESLSGATELQSRAEWEASAFTPIEVDEDALRIYLTNLFGVNGTDEDEPLAGRTALLKLQQNLTSFGDGLIKTSIGLTELQWSIKGLISSDMLSNEQSNTLRDFLNNESILSEISDVLTMRMAALTTWKREEKVSMSMKRKLNGTFTVHMHEDLLQAIFLHYIGVKWGVHLKRCLMEFRLERAAWKPLRAKMSQDERRQREHYLGVDFDRGTSSLQARRIAKWFHNYFLAELPNHEAQNTSTQHGEEEAKAPAQQFGPQQGLVDRQIMYQQRMAQQQFQQRNAQQQSQHQMAAQQQAMPASFMKAPRDREYGIENSEHDDQKNSPNTPMAARQDLLRLLVTDLAITRHIHNEATCFRSTFTNWDDNLPHGSILTVLSILGIPDPWLSFFSRFLSAPIHFSSSAEPPRTRKRGSPPNHSLTTFFSEALLFPLSLAINKSTHRSLLHRLGPDLWFWHRSHATAICAWSTTASFASAMGLTLDLTRSGTIRVGRTDTDVLPIDPSLPAGDIRWGLLRLQPLTGRFEIDNGMVDSHISDLKRQVHGKPHSVFGLIQTWNAYASTFFPANFGSGSGWGGREHEEKVLAAHARIEKEVFMEGSVVAYLRRVIGERFGVEGVVDGFLFWPTAMGGLGLKGPFVKMLAERDVGEIKECRDLMAEFEKEEKEAYVVAKASFYEKVHGSADIEPAADEEQFFGFEEFVKWREESDYGAAGIGLSMVWDKLMPKRGGSMAQGLQPGMHLSMALRGLDGQKNLGGLLPVWHQMEPYWRWITLEYGPEVMERFGGLRVVDAGLLPVGMVGMVQARKIKWMA